MRILRFSRRSRPARPGLCPGGRVAGHLGCPGSEAPHGGTMLLPAATPRTKRRAGAAALGVGTNAQPGRAWRSSAPSLVCDTPAVLLTGAPLAGAADGTGGAHGSARQPLSSLCAGWRWKTRRPRRLRSLCWAASVMVPSWWVRASPSGLTRRPESASEPPRSGFRAAAAWPTAPRPVTAADLATGTLGPAGDAEARRLLRQ